MTQMVREAPTRGARKRPRVAEGADQVLERGVRVGSVPGGWRVGPTRDGTATAGVGATRTADAYLHYNRPDVFLPDLSPCPRAVPHRPRAVPANMRGTSCWGRRTARLVIAEGFFREVAYSSEARLRGVPGGVKKHVPIPQKEYGQPHPVHHKAEWWPRAEKIVRSVLAWSDVRQLSIFGRNGYYVNRLLFATVPLNEALLEIWVRLPEADAAELAKNSRASRHDHPVPGWMRLRVDNDSQVDEATGWIERAYRAAIVASRSYRGVPVEKVPELPGHASHRVPFGPRTSDFVTGLDVAGALPQKPEPSNLAVRPLP